MTYYIGCKMVAAEPKEKDGAAGYEVVYKDGYVSWSPKAVFEEAYMKVQDNPRLPSGVSIGPDMVRGFIKEKHVCTMGGKNTVVRVVLVNGFEIIESSACVDPLNYSEKIGAEICMKKIEDKIWMLLGFLLQTAFGGVK